ncbi:tripartite tricarboxylate transporter permease [Blastococcus haudaquaticus]|uniref:Putative tricarboxylic transport membrane protein n=1 Tax=Blastococcus haudaquaticus TaxID=1938745 RepID=A0A286GTV6_9ACTN|nr:tripartite tricarboxylate transporter permease [Blastococcus haudaquaticus]SOD98993.1 putative tricarboxylic transport membrane protein [Blastococcus haudaquaticus]
METLDSIVSGFSVVLTPENLLYVFIGVFVGMIIGVLPGLGSSATMALVLPFSFQLPAEGALIMLAGIYYGSMYGGTITSVLLRLPGEAASVVTTFDGYQMARQGRAGSALGIAAVGSFVGGTVGIIGLSFLAPPLADFAIGFGAPEYTALAIFGILMVSFLGTKSLTKSLVAAGLGLLLATIGQDPVTGSPRFTMGSLELLGGLDFLVLAVGLFGIADVLYHLEEEVRSNPLATKLKRVWPSRKEVSQSKGAIARGSVIGFFVGILPGGGGVLSSLASYGVEKRIAKDPTRFGRGAIEGVAGPETANNAGATSAFIPLLTLGIPANSATAILFGALLLQGITPGPFLISEEPDVFWGVIDSMYIGNLMLLVLSVPLVGIFIQILRIRLTILGPIAIIVTMLGTFSINNNVFDMWIALAAGIVGYFMMKGGFEPGPLVLAFLLGSLLENSFRTSLAISDGDLSVFVTRPVSGTLFALIVLAVAAAVFGHVRSRRRRAAASAAQTAPVE